MSRIKGLFISSVIILRTVVESRSKFLADSLLDYFVCFIIFNVQLFNDFK